MSLEKAVVAALRLRETLAQEIEEAREERNLLKRLDHAALFDRAGARARFLDEAARSERELAASLAAAADALGLQEVTLASLEQASPTLGRDVAAILSDVRALAAALAEIDALNASLARRALACVRGYVDALAPTPRAYERAGLRATATPALVTVSSRG